MSFLRIAVCLATWQVLPALAQNPPTETVGTYTLLRAGTAGVAGAVGTRSCGLVGPTTSPMRVGLFNYENGETQLTVYNSGWQLAPNSAGNVVIEAGGERRTLAMRRDTAVQLVARIGWVGQPRAEAESMDRFADRLEGNQITLTFPNAAPVSVNGFSNLALDALAVCMATWPPPPAGPTTDPFAPPDPSVAARAAAAAIVSELRLQTALSNNWLTGREEFGSGVGAIFSCSIVGPENAATASHLQVAGNALTLSLIDRVGQFRGAVERGDPAVVTVGLVVSSRLFPFSAARDAASRRLDIEVPMGEVQAFLAAYQLGAAGREMVAVVEGAGQFRFALPDPAAQAPLVACMGASPRP